MVEIHHYERVAALAYPQDTSAQPLFALEDRKKGQREGSGQEIDVEGFKDEKGKKRDIRAVSSRIPLLPPFVVER